MNPFSDSALALRRRSVWEAVDSGVLLWRSNFIYFIPFFALSVGIVACGLRFLPSDFTYVSYLALWWLKPFFDRLVLHVISRRFFGSPAPRFGELRRTFDSRGLWGMRRGLLGDLLWRRFSPIRAASMPIRVLERVGRKQIGMRKKTLAAGGLNFCSLVSVFGLALEGMLLLGELYFVVMVTYLFLPLAFGYMRDNPNLVELSIFVVFCLNYVLVESLYVCMGFGLYVNSRVEVEGWDLQLLFQKFAGPQKAAAAATVSRPGVMAVLALCLFLALPQAAYAEESELAEESTEESIEEAEEPVEPIAYFPDDFPFADEESLESLKNILASPDFGSEKEGWGIRSKKSSSQEAGIPDEAIISWLQKIRQALGFMLRGLAVLAIAAALCFAFFWFWKNRRKRLPRLRGGGKSYVHPRLPPESPEALFARAEVFFRQGNLREAWAACLAGCIGAYARYRSLAFPANATEYGCLELVRRALPAEAGGFEEMVQSWVFFAYGGRIPGEGAFERALTHGRALLGPRT